MKTKNKSTQALVMGQKTQQQGIKKGHLYQPVDFSMRLPKNELLGTQFEIDTSAFSVTE